ncbi:flagellar hook-basal body complex protein FliE [Anaerobaca lacustris]|uniref:Flagellar hook-basal body complex protein FliE n=1 Tax=Anaerobaca lacustris TaxID=3044600 RepID=A0AAW6TWU2_9BACT|nr:flagellar hook-basal body complex protein FliE [Sedimentisphaerales bacterium M17dextr]
MIQFDPNVSSTLPRAGSTMPQTEGPGGKADFSQAVKALDKYVSQVDDLQQTSDASIEDLLTGKNNDITAVVSSVAKADVSFKVLVGVRNKLIEAYKQTMNMPL